MDLSLFSTLKEIYRMNSHDGDGMDGAQFAKLTRELVHELVKRYTLNPVDSATIDLIFTKIRGRGNRRIDFQQFITTLEAVGTKMSASLEWVTETLCSIHSTKIVMQSLSDNRPVSGPASLYYAARTSSWIKSTREATKTVVNLNKALELSDIVSRDKRDTQEFVQHTKRRSSRRSITSDTSPASTVQARPVEVLRTVNHEAPQMMRAKENFLICSSATSPVVAMVSNPPGEFYKQVVSDKFLNPVSGYFEAFLTAKQQDKEPCSQ